MVKPMVTRNTYLFEDKGGRPDAQHVGPLPVARRLRLRRAVRPPFDHREVRVKRHRRAADRRVPPHARGQRAAPERLPVGLLRFGVGRHRHDFTGTVSINTTSIYTLNSEQLTVLYCGICVYVVQPGTVLVLEKPGEHDSCITTINLYRGVFVFLYYLVQ